jgi:hypothetical protein
MLLNNEEYKKVHRLFHTLWTRAVGQCDYIKSDWNALDVAIYNLVMAFDRRDK